MEDAKKTGVSTDVDRKGYAISGVLAKRGWGRWNILYDRPRTSSSVGTGGVNPV